MKHIFILSALKFSFLFAQFELDEYHNWNGKTFPNIEFSDLDGNQHLLSEINADVILLDYWYLACHPCLKSFPYIQDLREEYPNERVMILALNPLDDLVDVKQFQSDFNYTFDFGVVYKTVFFDTLKMESMPRTIIIDNNRIVLSDNIGFLGKQSINKYKKVMNKIISPNKPFWKF